MDQAAADKVKQIREFAAAGWLMKPEDCMFVLSQLSASEERVRKQLEIIRDRAQGELEDAETLVQSSPGLQAIASYVESLLPSPPQVIRG